MSKPKYSEGDIVLTDSYDIAKITEVEVLDDVFYTLYFMEKNRSGMLLEKYIEGPATSCGIHKDFVYHDSREEWVCPWCDL